MGKAYSMLIKKMNRFNVENRAHRFLTKDKREAPPWHTSTQQNFQRTVEDTPQFMSEHLKKDERLDKYLRQVYVTSKDVGPKAVSKRSLPQNRRNVDEHEFGYYEPSSVPEGFCTLRQALKFISDHQGDPKLWTATRIAQEYKLNPNRVEKILEYYQTFNIYIPEIKDPKTGKIVPGTGRILRSTKPELSLDEGKLKQEEKT